MPQDGSPLAVVPSEEVAVSIRQVCGWCGWLIPLLGLAVLPSCGKKAAGPPAGRSAGDDGVAEAPVVEEGSLQTVFRGAAPLRDMALVPAGSTAAAPETLVAVGDLRTVVRSIDGGKTWAAVMPPDPDGPNYSTVRFGPSGDGWILSKEQVLHSGDDGATWSPCSRPSGSFYYYGALSAAGNACYMIQPPTCGAHVFCSEEEGVTWRRLEGALPRNDYSHLHFRDARRGWVVGDYGRFAFTEDGGANWTVKNFPADTGFVELEMVADDFGWMRMNRGDRLWITRNGGADWTPVDLGTRRYWEVADVDFLDAQTGLALIRKGVDGSSVLLSRDAGATWTTGFETPALLTAMAFRDLEHGWFTGEDGRIYRTVAGTSFPPNYSTSTR